MATYTTIADVAAELGGVTLNASSTPTSSQVDEWIQDAEREVELLTQQVYSTMTVTSSDYEYHSYDGSGVIRLDKWPVVSIQSIEYEENGLGGASESWVSLTEGRTTSGNFILYPDIGAVKLHANGTGNSPLVGHRNIRVTYTYGHTSVPREIKRLVTKLAAMRYIDSVANNTGSTGGGAITIGTISINDPNNYVGTRLTQLKSDVDDLLDRVVGRFRTVNYGVRLY